MKAVINECYGGFSLSRKAMERLYELKGKKLYVYEEDFRTKTWTKLPEGEEPLMVHYLNSDFGDTFVGSVPNENHVSSYNIERNDPDLVKVVEELEDKANGSCSKLEIIDIPDDIEWEVEEYDGMEWLSEKHMRWG
jgi:outer membrane lipoprotein-sorting protein